MLFKAAVRTTVVRVSTVRASPYGLDGPPAWIFDPTTPRTAVFGRHLARRAGVTYSTAYGDQPAKVVELHDWALTSGFEVVAAANDHVPLELLAGATVETPADEAEVIRTAEAGEGEDPSDRAKNLAIAQAKLTGDLWPGESLRTHPPARNRCRGLRHPRSELSVTWSPPSSGSDTSAGTRPRATPCLARPAGPTDTPVGTADRGRRYIRDYP